MAHNLMVLSSTINKLRHSIIALNAECFMLSSGKKSLMLSVIMLYAVMLKVVMLSTVYDECRYAECHSTESRHNHGTLTEGEFSVQLTSSLS